MSMIEAVPVNATGSIGFDIAPDQNTAAPFTASNNTWTQITASTSQAWGGFWITVQTRSTNETGIFNVAIGAASSEVIIATMGISAYYGRHYHSMYVPIPVASGTRISVAAHRGATGANVTGQIIGIPATSFDATPAFTRMECGPFGLSADANYGRGVIVDPGATNDTKGSWTELSYAGSGNLINGDSLSQAYEYIGIRANADFNVTANRSWLIDFAHGASGLETIFAGDLNYYQVSYDNSAPMPEILFPWNRASGDRIAARAAVNDASSGTARNIRCLLYGLR